MELCAEFADPKSTGAGARPPSGGALDDLRPGKGVGRVKKRLACLAAALLVAALLAGPVEGETDACVGAWRLVEIRFGGASVAPEALGLWMCLELNADGSGSVRCTGGAFCGSWSARDGGTVFRDGRTSLALAREGTCLTAAFKGMQMRFRRADLEAAEAPACAASSPADYDGAWRAATVRMFHVAYPAESMLDGGVTLVIREGRVARVEDGSARTLASRFSAGALELEGPGGARVRLRLHEDGALSARSDETGEGFVVFFERIGEARPALLREGGRPKLRR